jgi:type II secretory pathway component PulJ
VRRGPASQDGFTVVELVIGTSIMLVLLLATFAAFDQALKIGRQTDEQNSSQDGARTAIDQIARNLRNVSEPTPAFGSPAVPQPTIERATAYDLVIRTVDPAAGSSANAFRVRRVRYCLSADTAGRGQLWQQTQTWTTQGAPSMPSATACDGSGWPTARVMAQSITNRLGGRSDRPVFAYNPPAFTDASQIRAVRIDLWLHVNPTNGRSQTELSTAYYLRNQNQPPVSDAAGSPFTVTVNANGVVLNALGYEDPEGGPLTYVWYDGATKIGSGISLSYPASKGQHSFSLKVVDDRGLAADAPPQVVNVT